jgi:hypothetical protein
MALNPTDIINGSLSLILVMISFLVAVRILTKYFQTKERIFILVGISWIGVVSPWYSSSGAFLYYLFTQFEISDALYLFLGLFFIPITITVWVVAVSFLLNINKKKLLWVFYIILGALFEVFLLFSIFTNNTELLMTERPGIFDISYSIIVTIYLFINMLTFFIAGILFAKESLSSESKELKLKGKFLLLAFLIYLIGAILDGTLQLTAGSLIITRILLMTSAILFYLGFFFPNFVKNLFIS